MALQLTYWVIIFPNFLHKKSKGDILVYMDDDDYYPPSRVSHAVETLNLLQPQFENVQKFMGEVIFYEHEQ